MSEASQDDKTEVATDKKRREFRERGEVAKSKEIVSAVMLFGALFSVWSLATTAPKPLGQMTRATLGGLGQWEHFAAAPGAALTALALPILGILALPMGMLVLLALGSNLMQTGWVFTAKSFEFKPQKFNPLSGLKRTFASKDLWMGLGRAALKVGLLAVVALGILGWRASDLGQLSAKSAHGFAEYLQRVALWPLGASAAAMVALGLLDLMWQRRQMEQKMKMTKDEVKREHKQSEGDPLIKAQRKAKHRELLSVNQMLQDVGEATVVLNNPTHLSVALRYTPGQDHAPTVVAKGTDHIALKIREQAARHQVPMQTDIPLARALHKHCPVGHPVPEEFFQAVAQILAYLYARK